MGETTLTIDESVREQLDDYRTLGHNSHNDVLQALMTVLPNAEELQGGCSWGECDRTPLVENGKYENSNGVIRFFYTDYEGDPVYGSNYYCSVDHAKKAADEQQKHAPEEPDTVVVGGYTQFRSKFTDATFYIDGDTREVGLDIPGAFDGHDSHGNEYEYIGEPVYIQEAGEWVQKGVIDDIIHEEGHTTLILGHGEWPMLMLNHPDEEKRKNYREKHDAQSFTRCNECGANFGYPTKQPPEECPGCGSEDW